jgi:peptidyl-prolyl cis-trans isomerase D
MIQWMHRLSQSWVASILMGGLALSFVVWGIADVFTGQSSTALATVGSTEIDSASFQRTYKNYLRNESQQMGTQISADMAQKMGLGQTALQQLLSRTAIDNAIAKLGLTTPDDALAQNIRTQPAFRDATGKFSRTVFQQDIQNAGYTEQEYLAEARTDMTRTQLTGALEQGFAIPDGYARAIFLFLTEKRAVNYVVVSPDSVPPVAAPSDAVLAAYVKAHPERFSTPEYRDIEYAQIGPQDLIGQVNVTDAMVAQDYADHKATYQIPEKRDIQQIEFSSQADAAAAKAKADAGTSFELIAAARKMKPADLDLGEFSKDDLGDPARADAAFALPLNKVSDPVKGALGGYVLMRVTKIVPGVNHPLAEVADTIKKNLALQAAAGKLVDIVNAFEDARSGGADVATAAKKTGMHFGRITGVDKNGLSPAGTPATGVPADPEFLAQAFTAEVGEDNDPFPAKSGSYYAIKVDGVTPPKVKPLDLVRADASASWIGEQKATALGQEAASMAAKANKEKSLDGIAQVLKSPVQHSAALSRDTSDTNFSTNLIGQIFNAPPGGVVMAPQAVGGNFIIAQVSGISHQMLPSDAQTYQSDKAQIAQQAASDVTVSFANAARLQQGVKINQKLVDAALGTNQ